MGTLLRFRRREGQIGASITEDIVRLRKLIDPLSGLFTGTAKTIVRRHHHQNAFGMLSASRRKLGATELTEPRGVVPEGRHFSDHAIFINADDEEMPQIVGLPLIFDPEGILGMRFGNIDINIGEPTVCRLSNALDVV